jgi:hypothetical protein
MTKDEPCPRIVDWVAQPRRLGSRHEIELWLAERRRVLGELQRRGGPASMLFDPGRAAG